MTKKLIHKTTSTFLMFSVIVLILAAPLFYLITHQLYIIETDETLQSHKAEFLVTHGKQNVDLDSWNTYNRNVKIVPSKGNTKDSTFSKEYFNKEENEMEPYRELWAPIVVNGHKYTYVESSNVVEMEAMVVSIALLFLAVISILLIGIIWLSNRLSVQLWQPFYDTLRQITNFEIDKNKAPQFAKTEIIEFDTLNKSIERLIEKNTLIYKNQREFVENAAHELQTPLALFQTKIDTMMQIPDFSPQQSMLLSSLNEDVGRLNRLNKNLLLLSKIDNSGTPEKSNFIINEYFENHLDFFTEQAKSKNISIETDFRNKLEVLSDAGLAEILISNLFLNAIKHNNRNGKIIVVISAGSLAFINTGIDVTLDEKRLFNRFAKMNSSDKGNGLGLAIVKRIAAINQWEVNYTFANNLHEFSVYF